tara:strand:+ start:194 stop:1558 length:1365 start_codon:yes stop_codon:yes gene_type:complete
MANTSLIRTPSSTGNRKTFTFSAWFKKASIGAIGNLFSQYAGSGSGADKHFRIRFNTNDTIGVAAFSTDILVTNRVFRDVSSWYHVVLAVDTTQSTSSDRVKLYINGTQETSFSSTSYPSQNYDYAVNTASYPIRLGADDSDGNGPYGWFDGCMSHVHLTDGAAYAASTFGSTDSTTGEWKINTSPSVTYGTNGFFMFKDDASLNDDSGQGNNFTLVGGNFTKTEDNPSNVFATLNSLSQTGNFTLSGSDLPTNGNTVFTGKSSSNYPGFFSTLAASSGKYYAEFKVTSAAQGDTMIGVSNGLWNNDALGGSAGSYGSQDYVYFGYNGKIYTNGAGSTYGSAISLNDIVQIALDCDNNAMYVGVNGTYKNSGVPTSGASKTGAVNLPTSTTGVWHFAVGDYGTDGVPVINCNFGNGFFGTTAISSEGTNASGIGKFEYDVPAGYTALSTKGLNE